MNMFILLLTYQKSLDEVENSLPEHKGFLEKFYENGTFIASGRRNPRVGGVILCKAKDRASVESIIKEDPFYVNEIAKYEIIEFEVTMHSENFKWLLRD